MGNVQIDWRASNVEAMTTPVYMFVRFEYTAPLLEVEIRILQLEKLKQYSFNFKKYLENRLMESPALLIVWKD